MKGILWAVIKDQLGIEPLFEVVEASHITLDFGVELAEVEHFLGQRFEARLLHVAANDEIQAAKVELPEWVPFNKEIPHITISRVPGCPPRFSTEMLREAVEAVPVEGRVQVEIEFKAFN